MSDSPLVFSIFLVFSGAALLATLALYARQSLLVSYIVLGMLFGPWGLALVDHPDLLQHVSHMGVVFLLFLLGMNMPLQRLLCLLREVTGVTLASSLSFALAGLVVGLMFGYSDLDSLYLGVAVMFSSTIIALKLLPTTSLHHQRIGDILTSILLFQDLLAIVILLALQAWGGEAGFGPAAARLAIVLPLLAAAALLASRYVLSVLFQRFDTIHEFVFLVTLGWCLGVAQGAQYLGLSAEIGAFIAGVAVADNPIAPFIADRLRPLRDFFLVLFFFSLGASFNLGMVGAVLPLALVLAVTTVLGKPLVFRLLLRQVGERPSLAREAGARLGQGSEFALFIAVLALDRGLIGVQAAYAIQLTTLLTFVGSSYWTMLRYPTPIAVSAHLRRD